MAKRRSHFRNRIDKMQGLPIEEKMALLRMGELIDTAVNNRAITGPGENQRSGRQRFGKRRVPQPVNLTAEVGTRGAILRWDKVNSPQLNNYKVRITPVDGEGEELEATAFSNEYAFKGRAGRYKIDVRSIGRNGEGSDWSAAIEFTIQDSPMILEGNKFGVEELGPQISEAVLTPLNYTVFAFASVVLNSFADANNNPSVVLELRHGDTYEQSVFVQEFTLYPENEDLNNFDATVGITRPTGGPTRSGTFNTTQSAMFTPYQILEGNPIADLDTRFWVTVISHSDDVVGLSISIWVASEGLSEEESTDIPTHELSIEIPFVQAVDFFPGYWEFNNSRDSAMNNVWTFAAWVKPLDLSTTFAIMRYSEVTGAVVRTVGNRKGMFITYDTTPRLNVQIFNEAGTSSGIWRKNGQANIWPLGLDEWHFLAVTCNANLSGSKVKVYVNGQEVTAPDVDTTPAVTINPFVATANPRIFSLCGRPDTTFVDAGFIFDNDIFNCRLHMAGLWNVTLTQEAIESLYNLGNGFQTDWRFSLGAYGAVLDLVHYWKFGARNNIYVGPPSTGATWFIERPSILTPPFLASGTPVQNEIDFNVFSDVAFDIGRSGEPGAGRPYDFSNSIDVQDEDTRGGGNTAPGGSPGFQQAASQDFLYAIASPYPPVQCNRSPNSKDVVADFPVAQ